MTRVEKLSIALTNDLADLVREAVESGDYASTSEVVRDALREWKAKRELRGLDVEVLRRLWDEGRQSGPARLGTADAIKSEARSRRRPKGS
jgi:antitoxin ParD1/3/4